MPLVYEKIEVISLKGHPEWDERFVQQRIADDPAILGLGDLLLRDKERTQPRKGRLDLLLQSEDRQAWFEVEVQLGPTDEAHIIRTIEYWEVERKRYPDISHTAVIVAEEITSRFFNVIALFNQSIPLVAVKMSAVKIGDKASLLFTKVLDYLPRGLEEEDDAVQLQFVDRSTWEKKSTPAVIAYIDTILSGLKALDPSVTAKYNQSYVGTQIGGKTNNFVYFHPQSHALRMHIRMTPSSELNDELDSRGINWEFENTKAKRYRIRLLQTNFAAQAEFMKELVVRSYKEFEYSPAVV
jgi:predicted transport protein